MPQYHFTARNQQGELITGNRDAASIDVVVKDLLEDGITPIDIAESTGPAVTRWPSWMRWRNRNPTLDDLILFCRQMYTLTRAGIPIVRGVTGLIETSRNLLFAEALRQIRGEIESGHELSAALARYPNLFKPLFVSMVRVGEATGRLDIAFLQLAQYLELERDTRNRIKSALRYPIMVVLAIGIAIGVINVYVIPAFGEVFRGMNVLLPWQTRLLISISDVVVRWWPLLLVGLVVLLSGARAYIGTTAGKLRWDQLKLRLPIVGDILLRATLARFARAFSVAMHAGVPLVQALGVVAQAVDNDYLGARVLAMRGGIERGDSLTNTAAASDLFTPLVLQMLALGEETGELDTMMEEVAAFYEREVDYDIKNLSAAIEPVLIVAIGIMVLILALGVFLPMWDLTQLTHR